MTSRLTRRGALRRGAIAVAALGVAPAFWRTGRAAALPATAGNGPYGPLLAADANGIMLPTGFRSRVVAQGRLPVAATGYTWHDFADGAATFATPDGGWILVSNSEAAPGLGGGASAIRFAADGDVADAYRILGGTDRNCAGGRTPWGTWLSCEEIDRGRVWECDPTGATPAVARPAMGRFKHEAAAVDPGGQAVYLTEDEGDGGLYRFTPDDYPDLATGRLEVAVVGGDGGVAWAPVPDPSAASTPTRAQVDAMTRFARGEGIAFHDGIVYVATTTDSRVHAYDTRTQRIDVVYDRAAVAEPPLLSPDNLTVSASGDVFVGEDGGGADPLDLGVITPEGEVARFLKLTGPQHGSGPSLSEVTGPTFDPSGTRLYLSSQRASGYGEVYEISGPFRVPAGPPASTPDAPATAAPAPAAPLPSGAPPPAPAPALGLEVPRRRGRRALLRRGIPVALTLDAPARVTLVARATLRGRTVTLGRLVRDADRGPEQLRLRLGRPARERIRSRRRLRILVEVIVQTGGSTARRTRTLRVD